MENLSGNQSQTNFRPTGKCEICFRQPWKFHKHADGSWRAPSRSRLGRLHAIWYSSLSRGWKCTCENSQWTPRGVEGGCYHIKCVRSLIEREQEIAGTSGRSSFGGCRFRVVASLGDELFDEPKSQRGASGV